MSSFDNNSPKDEFEIGKVLFFDKPLQWTSFDIVNKVRNLLKNYRGLKKLKVGHAGTLDPLATGLLIVCTGKKNQRNHFLSRLQQRIFGNCKTWCSYTEF